MNRLLTILILLAFSKAHAQKRIVLTADKDGVIAQTACADFYRLTPLDSIFLRGRITEVRLEGICVDCTPVAVVWDTLQPAPLPVFEEAQDDTVRLTGDYTLKQTTQLQKLKWVNDKQGGTLTLPKGKAATGVRFTFTNQTKQKVKTGNIYYSETKTQIYLYQGPYDVWYNGRKWVLKILK